MATNKMIKRGRPRKYQLDETFFDVIDTPDKAYWLGFLFADGSIGTIEGLPYDVRVEIDKKDVNHLHELRRALSSNAPVKFRRNTASIVFGSKSLAQHVAVIRPKETATPWITWPNNLQVHFFRGAFDGDGCCSIVQKSGYPRVEFLGNLALCKQINEAAPVRGIVHKYHGTNDWLYNLYFYGKKKTGELLSWLYADADSWLDRKFVKFMACAGFPALAGGALPQKIQINSITGASSPDLIDNDLNAGIKQPLIDIFSIPDNTNISNALMEVTATGLKNVRFQDAAGNPGTAGYLQRNAANILFHDGTAARTLESLETAQTVSGVKTFSAAPVIATITNTGTLTLPTSTDTLVGRATTDTLTNKTLTSPTVASPTFSGTASGSLTSLVLTSPTLNVAVTTSGLTQATARLLGRTTASTGAIEELTVAASLTLSGGALSGTAASETQAGVVELATQAEVDTATDTTRVLYPNHNRLTLATPQATTSGTAFDFTGIPAGTRRITISFVGVSLSGTNDYLVQLGDAGGIETTGYISTGSSYNSTATGAASSTSGFLINPNSASRTISGHMTLTLVDSSTFTWCSSHLVKSDTTTFSDGGGDKSLSAELTQIRLTRSGTDTFDAGKVNILYER